MNRLYQFRSDISNKVTERVYSRHVKSYVAWWEADQAELQKRAKDANTTYFFEPAHPITAKKAVIFLNYQFDRKKKSSSGGEIDNTKVGCRAQRPLREDPDLRRMEEMASSREPKRLEESQEAKARGLLSKTFTEDELVLLSVDLFCKIKFVKDSDVNKVVPTEPKKASKGTISKALRNRAMLLCTASMALRGDDTRPILLSSLDNQTKALIVCANEGKTNTTGRLDQHPAFRHRNPDLCPISAAAFHLFTQFHITYPEIPKFAPKFKTEGEERAGPYGYREWY
ncbi:hypothetical protein CVT24_002556 [Panaeolus cyanescens]|uniref:Ndc10 domain-containing protein n=1 Tax=Panaeolus cyanescens TaxID=181874 RepID=A0A409X8C2_9AGAR|nr:hypothetical protein CVT24_002556 [Panaeolus cyanescens]